MVEAGKLQSSTSQSGNHLLSATSHPHRRAEAPTRRLGARYLHLPAHYINALPPRQLNLARPP